jgi:Leucine-rich repeat (LRR) protein
MLKKFFHNPDKETINIFEETTKISYEENIFLSLEALSLPSTNLKNLNPLSVFINLEILNIANNEIKDIEPLENLRRLKIIDLRFNKIEKLPSWIFKSDKKLYWERVNEEQEGIFLEGNPLDVDTISEIKRYAKKQELLSMFFEEKKIIPPSPLPPTPIVEVEQLIPLKREQIVIFLPQLFSSNFVNLFTVPKNIFTTNNELKLSISILEYSENYEILNPRGERFKDLEYIILILRDSECCLNPPILELLSELYINSKIFLIIENSNRDNMEEKITFFKRYSKSVNTIKVYHSFDKESNKSIKDEIYNYLDNRREANTLWRENWIALRDEIEESREFNIDINNFYSLAKKHNISEEVRDDIFNYLRKVGIIKEYSKKSSRENHALLSD